MAVEETDVTQDGPSSSYQYPFAASPDIIRANQKDAYFQGVLLEHLSDIIRQLYGSRFLHTYITEARTIADLLYLGLTTFVGNRTLGEEYCDIVQVDDVALRLPSLRRRAGYILGTIVVPYSLNKILPAFRRRIRAKLEYVLGKDKDNKSKPSRLRTAQNYILHNLDTLTSPAPMYAISLATFYFSGAYYHLAKRYFGLRYIFTRTLTPADHRVGYEVLGVLLVLQLSVQSYLHLRDTITNGPTGEMSTSITTLANAGSAIPGTAQVDNGVEVSLDPTAYSSNNTLLFEQNNDATAQSHARIGKMMHTAIAPSGGPRHDLADKDTMRWLAGRQARKCTLCLEPMKDPSSTTCGHLFCWTCICDWCKEKPECPLCRQTCLEQHILPVRG